MRIEHARSGMILARDILDKSGNLLLEEGITLTENYIARLKHLGVNSIDIARPTLPKLKAQPAIPDELRLELTLCYQALFNLKTEKILNSKLQTLYLRQLHKASDDVVTHIENSMPDILNVEIRKPTVDEISHAINVCLLSVATGLYLKLPRPALHDLAIGALLHDIGRSVIPCVDNMLVNSPTLHPLYGRDLILMHKFSPTIARITAEHHEHFDGSGFPLGLSGKATHPLSRIVAVANYFDNAATAAEKGMPLREVIEDLLASSDILFDHYTLRAFIYTIPVYTLGSTVLLSNGQIGCVVENRTHYPLRPLVAIQGKSGPERLDLAYQPDIVILDIMRDL